MYGRQSMTLGKWFTLFQIKSKVGGGKLARTYAWKKITGGKHCRMMLWKAKNLALTNPGGTLTCHHKVQQRFWWPYHWTWRQSASPPAHQRRQRERDRGIPHQKRREVPGWPLLRPVARPLRRCAVPILSSFVKWPPSHKPAPSWGRAI